MRLTGLTLPILLGALLIQVVTVVTKPGVCPTCQDSCTENSEMDCDSDKNCDGNQKCCQDGCLYSCTDPVEMTKRSCPISLIPCPWKLEMHCHSDKNCNGTQKCCLEGCNVLCKDPEVIKPGVCPTSPTPLSSCYTPIFMLNRHCTGDQNCNGTQKCCLYDCQYQCKDPAVIKRGECPRSQTPCLEDFKMDCLDDDNCNGTQKCCRDGCVYSCTGAVVIKPGECPNPPTPATAFPTVIPMKDRNCTGDQDCKGKQKCCKDGCGYSCKKPIEMTQRVCPTSTVPEGDCFLKIPSMGCRSDAGCKGGKICCYYNCNKECKDPIVIKPGKCPRPRKSVTACNTVIPMNGGNCTGDQNCNGTQKCCKDGCGYSCKDPIE